MAGPDGWHARPDTDSADTKSANPSNFKPEDHQAAMACPARFGRFGGACAGQPGTG